MLTAVLFLINLSVFVMVGLLKNTTDYPFGGEGPVPWYYKSAEVYANFNLVTGMFFLLAFLASLWAVAKRKEVITLIIFLTTILSAFVMMCI